MQRDQEYVRDHYEDILKRVSYKDWKFEVHPTIDGSTHYYLKVVFRAGDETHSGRKWLLSSHMTVSEIVQTALKAVLTAEEHEVREQFTYLGESIFGPHLNVDALFDFVTQVPGFPVDAQLASPFSYRETQQPGIPVMEQSDDNLNTI